MYKSAAPKPVPAKPALPRPKPFVAPQPSAQMPWTGQRGTLEDLGSFGISPEDFFGGGGRLMFSDTAAKPALTPKQGSMTTQQQAYINGFVKRASEYGLDPDSALDLLQEHLPESLTSSPEELIEKVRDVASRYPEVDGAGLGESLGIPEMLSANQGQNSPSSGGTENYLGRLLGGGGGGDTEEFQQNFNSPSQQAKPRFNFDKRLAGLVGGGAALAGAGYLANKQRNKNKPAQE
jgi:hypothetical protein